MLRTLALLVLALALPLAGCRSLTHGGTSVQIRSLASPATLTPALRTACYRRIDTNTADLYFSDLPEARLTDPADDLADAAGSILHIHYFLEPSPGNTPIDDTACNATIRHVIFAPRPAGAAAPESADPVLQVFGIYGGGGFFYPSGAVGDATFGGSMRDGTHRLLFASPGFTDLLGPASIEGRFNAVRDDGAAAAIQASMDRFLQRAPATATTPR